MKLQSLALAAAFVFAAPLFGQGAVNILFPSSDNRVLDTDGSGRGNVSHAEDASGIALNVGDNAQNQVWRSIVKFDLRGEERQVRSAARVILQLTARSRNLKTPRDWKLEIVHIRTGTSAMIDIDPSGQSDDFSAKGTVLHTEPAGAIRTDSVIRVVVTEQVKAALSSGVFAIRLQLDPATNNDDDNDQISFFSGSHGVNPEAVRPQLLIEL